MLSLHHVCKSYRRPGEPPLPVLEDLDLEIDSGEMVAIVGPSGSGKSTLMNLVGLLDRPDRGEIEILGREVGGLDDEERARLRNRSLGFVFQQFHLLPRASALENVELPLIYSDATEPARRAAEALCRVGLEDRLAHWPNELSGGQQQRVAIARALVNGPDLVLADEPTGNLDRGSADGVMELFGELNRAGTTILLITHDPEVASRASRVVRLDGGRLLPGPATPTPPAGVPGPSESWSAGLAGAAPSATAAERSPR